MSNHLISFSHMDIRKLRNDQDVSLDKARKTEALKSKSNKEQVGQKQITESDLELLKDFPGMKHIKNSKRNLCYRIIWFLIISISSIVCCYQILDRILFYLDYPVFSDVTVVRNISMKFPGITVCPTASNYPLLTEERKSIAKLKNLQNHCDVEIFDLLNKSWSIKKLWDKMIIENYTIVGVFQRLQIAFGGKSLYEVEKQHVRLANGICTRYSIRDLIPFKGEDLFLLAVAEDLPEKLRCNWNIGFHGTGAIAVYIHNDDDYLSYYIDSPFIINYNTSWKYNLAIKEFVGINSASKPCQTKEENKHCKMECLKNIIRTEIGCNLPYLEDPQLHPCSVEKIKESSIKFWREITKLDFRADCKCYHQCEDSVYTISLQQLHKTDHKTGSIIFTFIDNSIDKIRELYAFSLIALFCDIGGNLGLYLGLCVPGILEMIEAVCIIITKRISKST